MMKISIVEDEKEFTETLLSHLSRYQKENDVNYSVEAFDSAESYLNSKQNFDVIFLDINLTGMTGMELAKKIRENNSHIIIFFVTNLGQYAINGYEVNALDFCLKPISYPDFKLKMRKVVAAFNKNADFSFTIDTIDGIQKVISARKLKYVETIKHYLIFHYEDGDYKTRGTMKDVEAKLGIPCFIKINSGYLINMDFISSVDGCDVIIGEARLAISRSKKNSFLIAFSNYIGGFQS